MIYTASLDIVRRAPFRVIEARRVSPSVCQEMRRRFDTNARSCYRAEHAAPYGSQIHHKLPLCLGGDNNPDNLVMIEPRLHTMIHDYLDWQMRGMEIGDIRTLRLPEVPGSYWHITKTPRLKHG